MIAPMLLIDNKNTTDPAVNLSIEEYCLRNLDPKNDCVLFYINDPSVIIGKNQNPFLETDLAYVKKSGIRLVRRISGGGAVYHDHGNLNFSFITAFGKRGLNDFRRLLEPILLTLEAFGVLPKLMENNTIFVADKKISGNAQYTNLSRMLSHGTLLFDADLTALNQALRSTSDIFSSKGVASVRSTVTNISGHSKMPMDIFAFQQKLIQGVEASFNGLEVHGLSDTAWDDILRLARQKYGSWEWNYGTTPPFYVRHPLNEKVIQFRVEGGTIQKIDPEGNGSGNERVALLRKKLIGKPYDPEKVRRLFTSG